MTHRPRFVCNGMLTVALPPEKAFALFTAAGERLWVPHWSPAFVADVHDDTAVGTVWLTSSGAHETTWIVVESEPPRAATYARVTPGHSATIVRVRLDETDAGSHVRVGYDITSLDETADQPLEVFAAEFDDMLAEWEEAISRVIPELKESSS